MPQPERAAVIHVRAYAKAFEIGDESALGRRVSGCLDF